MFYHLPPVGTPISSKTDAADLGSFESLLLPYSPVFYDSGTAALAAALLAAGQLKSVSDPEVLIPAYGCPDLVSAVLYAGARPVLVDLVADRPWMDLQQVRERISKNTVAIVAVHLFGILERISELRRIAADAGALLVEDSAQAFPGGQEQPFWQADLVVLSFGRGKPVSALGGGAVLSKNAHYTGLLPNPPEPAAGPVENLKTSIKTKIYNQLINPRLYWLPNSLPFLHLGETHYHPLSAIHGMKQQAVGRVATNARRFRADSLLAQNAIRELLDGITGADGDTVDLPQMCGQSTARRLLRYPLLLGEAVRDTCLGALNAAGLGATTMYPASLAGISGLETLFAEQGACPQAERFARRIITLPTHPGVRHEDVEAMGRVLDACS